MWVTSNSKAFKSAWRIVIHLFWSQRARKRDEWRQIKNQSWLQLSNEHLKINQRQTHPHLESEKKPKIYGWKSNKVYSNTTECYDELSQCKRTSWSELNSTVSPHQCVFSLLLSLRLFKIGASERASECSRVQNVQSTTTYTWSLF